jgi:acid phosphatase family membrane protein YuiD
MDISYILTPFTAWLIAGGSKFVINSIKAKSAAFKQIGYGGFPSNHTSIVTSIAWLVAIKEGVESPALGVAIALSFIVILDATSLRIKVGAHAKRLNTMVPHEQPLRESVGHTPFEVLGGVLVGLFTALIIDYLAPWLTLH